MIAPQKSFRGFSTILGNNPEMNEGRHDTSLGKVWKWIKVKNYTPDSEFVTDRQTHLSDSTDSTDSTHSFSKNKKSGFPEERKKYSKIIGDVSP